MGQSWVTYAPVNFECSPRNDERTLVINCWRFDGSCFDQETGLGNSWYECFLMLSWWWQRMYAVNMRMLYYYKGLSTVICWISSVVNPGIARHERTCDQNLGLEMFCLTCRRLGLIVCVSLMSPELSLRVCNSCYQIVPSIEILRYYFIVFSSFPIIWQIMRSYFIMYWGFLIIREILCDGFSFYRADRKIRVWWMAEFWFAWTDEFHDDVYEVKKSLNLEIMWWWREQDGGQCIVTGEKMKWISGTASQNLYIKLVILCQLPLCAE